MRANVAQGITRFFVTDDNFARNRNWEPIFDRLIELREGEKLPIKLFLQVDTLCHRIPGFIEKAARAGVHLGVHRAREHQPRIADGRQEAAEQDLGIPRHAAAVAQAEGADLRRLHPRLPDRHPGDDRARHRDHQEGTADRPAGVLLPDPAARIRGPQEPAHEGRPDGPRHEQLRCRAPLHGASADVEADLGAGLHGRVEPLLRAGARRDDHAARRIQWNKPYQAISTR